MNNGQCITDLHHSFVSEVELLVISMAANLNSKLEMNMATEQKQTLANTVSLW